MLLLQHHQGFILQFKMFQLLISILNAFKNHKSNSELKQKTFSLHWVMKGKLYSYVFSVEVIEIKPKVNKNHFFMG